MRIKASSSFALKGYTHCKAFSFGDFMSADAQYAGQNGMKKIMRLIIMIGLLGLAIATANAQTTNVVLPAFFVLKGTTQTATGVKSVRLVNKDIIAALNETGVYQFGRRATLLLVTTDDETPVIM